MLKRFVNKFINIIKSIQFNVLALKKFSADKKEYKKLSHGCSCFLYKKKNEFRILNDYKENAGTVDSHYFLQDIFVAKYIKEHEFFHVYDVGSRLDGFISHLLSFYAIQKKRGGVCEGGGNYD